MVHVIVLTPTAPVFAVYNTFLGFNITNAENPSEQFQNLDGNELIQDIIDEVACPAEPVNLLTGSFRWEYTDLSLYGRQSLDITRYYESTDASHNYGFGYGWSTDYTAHLEIDNLYVSAFLPKGVRINFDLDYDNTYKANEDYTLTRADGGYVLHVKSGRTWIFDSEGKLVAISELDGSTTTLTYTGDMMTDISNDTGSFKLEYNADGNISRVTDSVGRSISLTYEGDYLTAVENPDGDSLKFSYDNGYLASVKNYLGEVYVENTYDDSGRVIHQYADNIGTFDFSYDTVGRHNICTGTDGYLCEIWYDELGRITKAKDASGEQEFAYNKLN